MAGLPLNVPVTETNRADWVRKAADAINRGFDYMRALRSDLTTAQDNIATLDGRVDTLETTVPAIDARVTTLETNAPHPTLAYTIFTPAALPGSPVEGMTAMDSTDHKLKTWDGTTWQAHW